MSYRHNFLVESSCRKANRNTQKVVHLYYNSRTTWKCTCLKWYLLIKNQERIIALRNAEKFLYSDKKPFFPLHLQQDHILSTLRHQHHLDISPLSHNSQPTIQTIPTYLNQQPNQCRKTLTPAKIVIAAKLKSAPCWSSVLRFTLLWE